MKQSEKMLKSGGNEWLVRNRSQFSEKEMVMQVIDGLYQREVFQLNPTSRVLEIGCSNGWRLQKIKDIYGCQVVGIEPGLDGVDEAKAAGLEVYRGLASDLREIKPAFDMVILGFCMAMIEPEDWLQVAAETDRMLKNGGILLIFDHLSARPVRMYYAESGPESSEDDTFWMYFYDWPKLWLSHPAYKTVGESVSLGDVVHFATKAVHILTKDMEHCIITPKVPSNKTPR